MVLDYCCTDLDSCLVLYRRVLYSKFSFSSVRMQCCLIKEKYKEKEAGSGSPEFFAKLQSILTMQIAVE
jgi:hypothetical protein